MAGLEPSPPAAHEPTPRRRFRRRCSRASAAIASCWRKSAACSSTMRRHISTRIRAAIDARDGEALRRAAHALKGAAANFDADDVVVARAPSLEEIGTHRRLRDQRPHGAALSRETDSLLHYAARLPEARHHCCYASGFSNDQVD